MDLYMLNILLKLCWPLNCELEHTSQGSVMRLDLLILVEEASGVLVSGLGFILLTDSHMELKWG